MRIRGWGVMLLLLCLASVTCAGQLRKPKLSTDELLAKAAPALRADWEENRGWHARTRWTEGFTKVHADSQENARRILRNAGFYPRSVVVAPQQASDAATTQDVFVASGRFRLRDLPKITRLEQLIVIEGAAPLRIKQ